MKRLWIVLLLLALIFKAGALEIFIEGYKGGNVTVNIIPIGNGTFSENITVKDSTIKIENITNGSYHLVVSYGEKQFVSTISIPENTSIRVDFRETNDANVIKADNIHFIINLQQNGIVIMEVINFENTADVYYHGDIVKKIPKGADHLVVDEQTLRQSGVVYDEILQEDGKITIKNATVQPRGVFSLAYLYFPSQSIELVVDYSANITRIIHPVQVKITPPEGFTQETQIQNDQGIVFNVLKAENLKKGIYKLNAEITDEIKSQATPQIENQRNNINLPLIAGIGLIAVGVILYILTSRKRGTGETEDEEEKDESGGWEI